MNREQLGRLHDILHSAALVDEYVQGVELEEFCEDSKLQDAIIRRLEIVGEAARHLPIENFPELSSLPLKDMRGMRNILAHDYGNIDLNIVWKVATVDVPQLIHEIQKFFPPKDLS